MWQYRLPQRNDFTKTIAMPTTNNESSNSSNVLQKVGLLLERTKDALIADLQQEFIGVRNAALKYEKEQSVANFVPIIDAVFAKVGYDISHYEELNEVRTVVEKLLAVTDKIADTVKDASKINDDGKIEADEIAKVASDVMPLVQEVVELVKAVSDIEWKAVAEDLSKSGKDMGEKIMNDIFTKDFARKVLDHILMTLLKNAKVVFKDEIEFAKFTIESGVNLLVKDAEEMAKVIKGSLEEVNDSIKNAGRKAEDEIKTSLELVQHTMQETLKDATDLYSQMENQVKGDIKTIAKEYQATYVKIANGLSIAYSILEFLGIVEEKKITLQLPDGLKEAIGKIQKASNDVADKIGDAVDTVDTIVSDAISPNASNAISPIVSDAVSTVVDTMDDAMKTTRDITGIGVAAAGKIGLQLQSIETFMNGATAEIESGLNATANDITSGLTSVASALDEFIGMGSNLKAGANNVAEKINGALQTAIDYRYPITINVISWEKVEDLFTNPIDHFKALYPIDSMADVESLMTKIMDILHRINSDIPDFSSLKKLLEDLLRKLQRMVMKKINELKAKINEVGEEVKGKIKETIQKIWDWFQPVVTTIRNVIRMLKELALELKGQMKNILEEVKDGAVLIATDLQNDFNRVKKELEAGVNEAVSTVREGVDDVAAKVAEAARKKINAISTEAGKFINGIENAADDAVQEATKVAEAIVNGAENAVNAAVKDLDETAQKKAKGLQAVWLEIQEDMPKMPKLNLPKVVRTTLVEPMANCVKDTLKESLEIDLSSVIDFSQQRNELVACVEALRNDYKKFEKINIPSNILKKEDFTAVLNIKLNDWKNDYELPDIPQIVKEIVVPDLQAWAYGMVNSVQALVDPKAWMKRFDTLVTQLRAEFQNDLSNVTGLISKEGAMRLLDDASAVKKDLQDQLNITDYINILETSVNDVVLPDPEYYYSSFKQCILGIITKLTARIIEETNKIKKNVAQIKNNLKSIPDQIKNNVDNLLRRLEEAKKTLAGELGKSLGEAKEVVLQFIEDVKATAKAIKNIVEKIPETIDNLVVFIKEKLKDVLVNIQKNAKDILKNIADTFVDKLEDLAAEMWNKLKNEYIIPMLKAIKRKVIYFVKHVIREKISKFINAITDLSVEENSLLDNSIFFQKLHTAQVKLAKSLNPVIEQLVKSNSEIKQLLGDKKAITNINQLPAIIKAVEKSSKTDLQDIFKTLTINIQFDENKPDIKEPDIIVPYYYITWVQGTLSATVEFVQSDMGLKEIITLVQALYKSVPEEIKQQVADVLPSLPSLPSNGFTDLLNDVTCSYDLDNMMANVTLLDLKVADNNDEGSVAWDTSLKLQLFIMAGLYSKDGFVEKKDEDDNSKKDKEEGAKDQDGSTDTDDETKEEEDNTVPAIFFTIMLQGEVMLSFKLGDKHYIEFNGTGCVGSQTLEKTKGKEGEDPKDISVGFCLSKKDTEKGVTSRLHAFGSTKSLAAMLSGEFSRNKEVGPANVIETKYLDVRIGNYPIGLYVLYNEQYPSFNFGGETVEVATFLGADKKVDGFTAGAYGAVKDFEVVLKLRENDFFRSFLKDDISAKFDLALAYDYIKGFKMDGGYTFHIDIDCNNKEIGPLTLSGLGVDLGSVKNEIGSLQLCVGSSFTVSLGDSVTMTFDNLGVGAFINIFKKDDNGKLALGDFDLDFKFKFPEGIGIAIDCEVVKGSALIGYDDEKKELFGAMELSVLEKFGVGAMLIMTFGDNFSMVAMLSVRFSPGIPLGMGFSLTAIGGMLGLNRMLDYDAIRESVRNGSLASVFFVEDVMKHIGDMRKAAEKIFPAKRDQFFVGLLGQISYEPVVKCSFGLMFQAPDPLSIIIVGDLKVAIEGADVIRINVAFSGEIDFNKGLQFDAALYDSEIVGIRLEGDMAFRLFCGGPVKGFLMSVGGFHPAYKPEEAMHVSDMRRLAMKLDYDVLKVGLETYLAITSNTFQIGAHLDIKVGWDKFGIIGYAGFDALFQFDPFMFMFDIEAGMAVMIGSSRLMSIDLALALSGPRPWHAKGKAKFYFLFIPINVGFDVTWGNKQQSLPNKQIEVLKLLEEQINNLSNWSVDENSRRDSDVILLNEEKDGKEKKLVLSPNGVLTFSQSAIPLEMKMQLCDNAVPTDCNEVMIDKVVINGNTYEIINKSTDEAKDTTLTQCAIGETINADFAPALYLQMDNDEKLNSPSYVQYASGFTMKNGNDRMVGGSKTHDLGKIEQFIRGVEKSDRTFAGTSTGGRVAYPKTDMVSVERYVNILDTIQSEK